MRRVTDRRSFACDVETFWKVFFDRDWNRRLYLEELGFKRFEIVEQTETLRILRATPKVNAPGPVAALLGDSFGYEEEGRFDREKNSFEWRMMPNSLKGKLHTTGLVRVAPEGDAGCTRLDEVTVEAKVFGVGGVIESATEKEVRSGWARTHAFMDRYLRDELGKRG